MSFPVDDFIRLRPYLYHLTASDNLGRIKRTRRLESAARILIAGGRGDVLRSKRRKHEIVEVGGESIHVRDQSPLHAGNTLLSGGWTFEDLIQELNHKVFFWPGTDPGPISYGIRHFARYRGEAPRIIRVSTQSILAANLANPPLYCRYNSGSPRCSRGQPSPRSPDTFRPADQVGFRAAQVVEVVFEDFAELPVVVEVGQTPLGPWIRL